MRLRWITLLLGLYVALDFANPMVPGAVQLVDGTLETVAGCQERTVATPSLTPSAQPRHSSAGLRHDPRRQAQCAPVVPARPPAVVRVVPDPCSSPASSPDDD